MPSAQQIDNPTEILGVGLATAQRIDNPTKITISIAGQDILVPNPTKYSFTVSIAGQDTLVELQSYSPRDPDCAMFGKRGGAGIPSGLEFEKDFLAWAESLPDYGSELQRELENKENKPESEFQRTSMMELKRIAAEVGY